MDRSRPPTIAHPARRLIAAAACAAVLLTSFEDEVLLAAATVAAGESCSSDTKPDDSHLFPDLSRAGEAERDRHPPPASGVVARLLVDDHGVRAPLVPPDGRPPRRTTRAALCVWRI